MPQLTQHEMQRVDIMMRKQKKTPKDAWRALLAARKALRKGPNGKKVAKKDTTLSPTSVYAYCNGLSG